MKTITLRTLMREPRKVKRLTSGGKSVQVTDGGVPLWLLTGIKPESPLPRMDEAERARQIDEILDGVLHDEPSQFSAAKLLEESRR